MGSVYIRSLTTQNIANLTNLQRMQGVHVLLVGYAKERHARLAGQHMKVKLQRREAHIATASGDQQ
jgi:hypothetical protein